MKLKCANMVIDGVVVFVLKVLGAFGACWGSFSAASIAYREFGGGPKDVDFMSNPVYAKTALGVSLGAATLSAYAIARDKLESHYAQKKIQQAQDIDIAVTIPLCNSYQRNRSAQYDIAIEMEPIIPEEDKQNPLEVICRKRHRSEI